MGIASPALHTYTAGAIIGGGEEDFAMVVGDARKGKSAECGINVSTGAGGSSEKMGIAPPALETYPADAIVGGGEEDVSRVVGDGVVMGTTASRKRKSAPT